MKFVFIGGFEEFLSKFSLTNRKAYFYILEISDYKTKVGFSLSIRKRIQAHNEGLAHYADRKLSKIAIFELEGSNKASALSIEGKYVNLLSSVFEAESKEWFYASFDSVFNRIINYNFTPDKESNAIPRSVEPILKLGKYKY